VTPATWVVLAIATGIAWAISFFSVLGVICLVQGVPPWRSIVRTSTSALSVAGVNIMIGLVVLQVLQGQAWSVVLLIGLTVLMYFVYRSYAQFMVQHRSLTELYELTQAMSDAGRDDTLPDVLLVRVRELLQAEYATLWLPAQGRYPEVLLSARVDAPGLLDVSQAPPVLRERAVKEATRSWSGPRVGESGMRALIRGSGVKDAIVVPLRLGLGGHRFARGHRPARVTAPTSCRPTCGCWRRSPPTPRSRWRTHGWSTGCASTPTTTR
jgi:hypothetical protein